MVDEGIYGDGLLDELESSREARVALALADVRFFAFYYLGDDLQEHQVRWIERLRRTKRGGIIAPSGHGKTTAFGKDLITHEIARNRNIRILYISRAEGGVAEKSVTMIRDILKNNKRLVDDFGQFYSPLNEWSSTRIEVIRSRDLKEKTLEAVGLGSAITGGRFDLILLDDIVDPYTVTTPQIRKKIREYIIDTVIPRLDRNGRLWFVGTRQHRYDIYEFFMSNKLYHVVTDRAIIREPLHDVVRLEEPRLDVETDQLIEWEVKFKSDDRGECLAPNLFRMEDLLLRRVEMTPIPFNKVYQGIVVDDDTVIFKSEWLERAKDYSRSYSDPVDHAKYRSITGGVDPALTIDKESAEQYGTDWAVWLTLGDNAQTNKLDILGIDKARGLTPDEVVKQYEKTFARFQHDYLINEINSFGTIWHWLVKQNKMKIPVAPHRTGRDKKQILVGIPSLAQYFEQDAISLPYRTAEDRAITQEFIEELFELDLAEHTPDQLIAFWLAVIGWRQFPKWKARQQTKGTWRERNQRAGSETNRVIS